MIKTKNIRNDNNYSIIENSDIDFLQFNKLLEFNDKLSHAFTLKKHGIGFKRYNNDNIRNISINSLIKGLKINPDIIIQPHQGHTNNIYELRNEMNKNYINNNTIVTKMNNEDNCLITKTNSEAKYEEYNNLYTKIKEINIEDIDGVISNKPKTASILTFADCVPLLFYDPENNVYANIHSGWKGTVKRIAQEAIKRLVEDYNCKENDIICCIGPCIRKECFLVNDDVVEIYKNEFGDYLRKNNIIESTNQYNEKGKQSLIDNVEVIKCMLRESKIIEKNIIDCQICTYCNSDRFHSRRKEKEIYQTCGSLMMIKE